jgi:hypothetical protein
MTTITNNLKRRFVKDYKLPIQLVQEPYFSYFLDLYEPLLGTQTAYNLFVETLEQFNTPEEFFQHASFFSDTIIQRIQSKEEYKHFSNCDMNGFKPLHQIGQQKLYQQDNAEKDFVAIDLKKANFQAFKFFDRDIIDQCLTYEEFVKKTVPDSFEYFYKSKQIRQVIFGNLNPKRQQKVQKYLMSVIMDVLMKAGLDEDAVFSSSADELVVSDNQESIVLGKGVNTDEVLAILKSDEITSFLDLHIESFKLEQVHPDFSFFVKSHENGKKEFKNVPAFNMAEVYKFYNNMDINNYDLAFFHEGRIANFQESIFS